MAINKINFIYLKLGMLKDKIVSRDMILNIINQVDKKNSLKILENLRKAKKIEYIFLNYYYILSETERKTGVKKYFSEELVLAVLNKLKIKWHYGFNTALERKNLVWEVSKNVTILNNVISKKMIIGNIIFHFVKSQYVFDYKSIRTKNRIFANYPSNEKLGVDYIYFNMKLPLELKNRIIKSKFKTLIKYYPQNIQNKIKNEKYWKQIEDISEVHERLKPIKEYIENETT